LGHYPALEKRALLLRQMSELARKLDLDPHLTGHPSDG
jgi:hypothetical protein